VVDDLAFRLPAPGVELDHSVFGRGHSGRNGHVENPGFYTNREGRVRAKGMFQCPLINHRVFHVPPGYRPANNPAAVRLGDVQRRLHAKWPSADNGPSEDHRRKHDGRT
jgi:hypothetical protein